MKIPSGKKIKIRENGIDIFENAGLTGVEMFLESEITINLSSSFEELLSFGLQKATIVFRSLTLL